MASLMSKSALSARVAARPARAAVRVNALMGNKWYPGATSPAHLDGSMAGDYGFDPLRLGTNKDTLKWFREAELTNGRWAMAAVVGILFTDLVGLPLFTEAGAQEYAFDNKTLAIVEAVVFAIVEGFRYNNIKNKGVGGFMTMAPFDPMGMNSKDKELKEIKNGRLAMLAFVGFCSQAAIYGKGPIECLSLHLADPGHNNIYTSPVGKETCVTVAVLSVWPMIVEATKTLNKSGKEDTPSLFPWAEPWKQQ